MVGWAAFFKIQNDEMEKDREAAQRGSASSISITDLDGKKYMTIKPKDVHQVIQLPHTGYVNKHPELKKYGFR